MSKVGKSEIRVDAFDKVTGRTKYYEDQMPNGALYVRIKHSTIAHGFVKSIDKSAAEATDIMLQVHRSGAGVAGVYTLEVAETKAAQTIEMAKRSQHPLRCKVEKE